ncbi:MAG: EpsG family protein [bacterium]|nr:EpsG family protein [bacterium]
MSDFESLIFYIISFLVSFFLYALYNKYNKKVFLIISFIIPCLIGGLRYNVGTDFQDYYYMYLTKNYADVGFKIISIISSHLTGFQSLIFIYNFLSLFFIFLGLKNINKNSRSFAYLCYLFLHFTSNFNGIRQMLAVSIIFFAYKYINEKNLKKYLIFVLLAGLCHTTAFLCIPLYFIFTTSKFKNKALYLILMIILSINFQNVITLLGHFSLFNKYMTYLNYQGVSFNNYSFFLDLLILFYILHFKKRIIKNDERNSVYIYIYIFALILSITGFFSPFVKRISTYFKIIDIFLLGSIPSSCFNNKNKLLNYIIIIFLIITKFVLSAYVLKQANIIPYYFMGGN